MNIFINETPNTQTAQNTYILKRLNTFESTKTPSELKHMYTMIHKVLKLYERLIC
jgi:hypothetical protein